ncbi:glutaredoxin family protein [Subtercola sp. PAMC28395]|uniref:glutaredoxin family protein n=1 Tax=Subtercola sp. PAMC28395 TaxID=2846775 RepID=UPI001C0B97EF|nr:glutaredoxin family protein [Subtercola sp. PAMC28395]QWT24342.1 glutaredoxin family protein [Subtercola sp. PAMC28395]
MAHAEITLIGKPGCHLCDDARTVIAEVTESLRAKPGSPSTTLSEVSILDDQALFDEHVEDIPVVLINGRIHTFWRVDPARLTAALLGVR